MALPDDSEVKQIVANSTQTTLAPLLVKGGFSHLVIDQASWEYSAMQLGYSREPFLSQFTAQEFTAYGIKVYRIREEAVGSGAAENLLTNPGFEILSKSAYPDGWVVYGKPLIAESTGQEHRGSIAVRAGARDGLYNRVAVEAGKQYSLGYWCRADKPDQFALLQIRWLDARSEVVGVSTAVVSAGSQWSWQGFSAMSPQGVAVALAYVSVQGNSEVWFDDCMFVRGEMPAKR
jgi:hypothetical protein